MNFDVFISYRRSDGAVNAQLVARVLREQRYSIFLDKLSLRSGNFPKQIKNNVINCTDFIMIITKDYFSEKILKKNDWVRKEIKLALQYKKNIIPYFFTDQLSFDNVPKDIKIALSNQGLCHILTPSYDSTNELINILSAKPSISSDEEELKNIISMYDASYGDEYERLKVQANRSQKDDDKIIKNYTKGKNYLHVLDVGCAYGYTGQARFSDSKYCKILGIDKNRKCINYANEHCSNEKFCYEIMDIESENMESALSSAMEKHGINSFDIIFISQVLHHVSNPLGVLRSLRKFMIDGGLIYIREPDDGSKISSDPNLEKILEITSKISGVSDRYFGRKIYGLLCNAGYKQVKIHCFAQETSRESYDEKVNHFEEGYSFRINYAKKLYKQNPSKENRKLFLELEMLLAKFEQSFYSVGFWYCGHSFIGVAIK